MKTACRNACVSPSMPTPWRPVGGCSGAVLRREPGAARSCGRRSGGRAQAHARRGGCGLRLRCGAPVAGARSQFSGRCVIAPWPARRSSSDISSRRACCGPGACSCRGVWPGRPTAASLHGGGRRRGDPHSPPVPIVGRLCAPVTKRARLGPAPELQVRGELARGELVDVLSAADRRAAVLAPLA